MGMIVYGGSSAELAIDDRALAHLKVVISTKLRRGESFTLSWQHAVGEEPGRSSLWLSPSVPLRFIFDDAEPKELSRAWLEDLARSAHVSGNIQLTAEPIPEFGNAD